MSVTRLYLVDEKNNLNTRTSNDWLNLKVDKPLSTEDEWMDVLKKKWMSVIITNTIFVISRICMIRHFQVQNGHFIYWQWWKASKGLSPYWFWRRMQTTFHSWLRVSKLNIHNLALIEKNLHEDINSRFKRLVDEHNLILPLLSVLLEEQKMVDNDVKIQIIVKYRDGMVDLILSFI